MRALAAVAIVVAGCGQPGHTDGVSGRAEIDGDKVRITRCRTIDRDDGAALELTFSTGHRLVKTGGFDYLMAAPGGDPKRVSCSRREGSGESHTVDGHEHMKGDLRLTCGVDPHLELEIAFECGYSP